MRTHCGLHKKIKRKGCKFEKVVYCFKSLFVNNNNNFSISVIQKRQLSFVSSCACARITCFCSHVVSIAFVLLLNNLISVHHPEEIADSHCPNPNNHNPKPNINKNCSQHNMALTNFLLLLLLFCFLTASSGEEW